MKWVTVISFVCLPLLIDAQTVTLYDVRNTTLDFTLPQPSVTVSAVGAGKDGATTYVQEVQASLEVIESITGYTTFSNGGQSALVGISTVPIPVRTYHATIVEDATHVFFSQVPTPTGQDFDGAYVSDCTLDGKGKGVCVEKVWEVGRFASSSTQTNTYTGTVVPWYTVTGSPQRSSANRILTVEQMAGWQMVFFGLIVGMVLGR